LDACPNTLLTQIDPSLFLGFISLGIISAVTSFSPILFMGMMGVGPASQTGPLSYHKNAENIRT